MSRVPQIIVADDDRTVRTVISHALSKQGYHVGAATSVAGLWDMVTTVTDSKLGTYHGTNFINIRTSTWKKLSEKEKQAFADNMVQAVVDMARIYEEDDAAIRTEAEAKGVKWLPVDDSFKNAVQNLREQDAARVIELAKSRGVENPEPIVEKFQENIAKWTKIVGDIGPGQWGDAEWAKYGEALKTEVFSKVSYD